MGNDLTEKLADILSEKVERWLDGETGVATFEEILRAALKEAGAVVELGWRKIEDAPKENGTTVDLYIEAGNRERFGIQPKLLTRAMLFSNEYWVGTETRYVNLDDDALCRPTYGVGPWNMNPTTSELIEMGAVFRPLPAPPKSE